MPQDAQGQGAATNSGSDEAVRSSPTPAIVLAVAGTSLLTWLLVRGRIFDTSYMCGLALVAVASLYLYRPIRWGSNFGSTPAPTRLLAMFLLFSFVGALAFTGMVAALSDDGERGWIEIFKSGFLLLGGGLTTVIGYYFGTRSYEQGVEKGQEKGSGPQLASSGPSGPRPRSAIHQNT